MLPPTREILAMTSLGNSFFDPDWWPNPSRAFLSTAKDEVREMLIAEDEGKNWKSVGDGDEKYVKYMWQRSWWTAFKTAAAQRLAHYAERSAVAMCADDETVNKNIYCSLSSFYMLVSVFQTLFLVFLGDDKHNWDPLPPTRKRSRLRTKWRRWGWKRNGWWMDELINDCSLQSD